MTSKPLTPDAAKLTRRLQAVAGTSLHGWRVIAAAKLGLSEQTLRNAFAGKRVPSLEKALRDYETAARDVGAVHLDRQAGTWVVGVPERHVTDAGRVSEIIVTHVAHPAMMLHVRRSAIGKIDSRAKWYDEPANDGIRKELIAAGREKAVQHIAELDARLAAAEARARLSIDERRRGVLTVSDIRRMSSGLIELESYGSMTVEINDAIQQLHEIARARRAEFDALIAKAEAEQLEGYDLASLLREAASIARAEQAATDLARHATAKMSIENDDAAKVAAIRHVMQQPAEHINSARRRALEADQARVEAVPIDADCEPRSKKSNSTPAWRTVRGEMMREMVA